jgi:hypothetical protein
MGDCGVFEEQEVKNSEEAVSQAPVSEEAVS